MMEMKFCFTLYENLKEKKKLAEHTLSHTEFETKKHNVAE